MPKVVREQLLERGRIGKPGEINYELARMGTKHRPGTEGKIRILELRAEFGLDMHLPNDKRDHEGFVPVVCGPEEDDLDDDDDTVIE
jgi:hypothetical protein